MNKALLPFVIQKAQLLDTDLYFKPRSDRPKTTGSDVPQTIMKKLAPYVSNKARLIFYFNCFIKVCHFCISLNIALEILAIIYGKKYLGFF